MGSKKSCPFRDFIVLTASPLGGAELIDWFQREPEVVAAEYDLTDSQVTALQAALAGDQNAIQAELDAEGCPGRVRYSPFGLMTV